MPPWAINLERINQASEFSSLVYSHDELRERLVASGASSIVVTDFDHAGRKYSSEWRKAMEDFLIMDQSDLHPSAVQDWVDYAGKNLLFVGFVPPSVPSELYDDYSSFVETHALMAARESESGQLDELRHIILKILEDDRLVQALAYVVAIVLFQVVKHPILPEAQATYKANAVQYLLQTYRTQANAFARKTRVGLQSITVVHGARFFKGKSKKKRDRLDLSNERPSWVGFEAATALQYTLADEGKTEFLRKVCDEMGFIAVYEATSDITMPDMSNASVVLGMRRVMERENDTRAIAALDAAFQTIDQTSPTGQPMVIRHSEARKDLIVAEWLCEHDYPGFAAARIGAFPPEIMFCRASNHLRLVGMVSVEEDLDLRICEPMFRQTNPRLSYDHGW